MIGQSSAFSTSNKQNSLSFLAIEHLDTSMASSLHGCIHREYSDHGCKISHAVLDGIHSYHTLITEDLWLMGEEYRKPYRQALCKIILTYLAKASFCLHSGKVLFCGLGNDHLTADALGPMIADELHAVGCDPVYRAAGFTELYILKPGVPARSGMKTGEHIRSAAAYLGVDLIITADSTSAKTAKRLASVIQVTDKGVFAGSGTGAYADEISSRTMPCPVISIGVPTVIRASLLAEEEEECIPLKNEDFLVSRSDTDVICHSYAKLIGGVLNKIFSPALSEE